MSYIYPVGVATGHTALAGLWATRMAGVTGTPAPPPVPTGTDGFLLAMADGLMGCVGVQGYSPAASTSSDTTNSTSFNDIAGFPDYSFNAPAQKTYLVLVSVQCRMSVSPDAVYFRLRNLTTSVDYDDASMRTYLPINIDTDKHFFAPVLMAAGANTLRIEWKVRDGAGTATIDLAGAGGTSFRAIAVVG